GSPGAEEAAAGSRASDSTISENSTSDELVVDGLAADTSAVAELTVDAPAEDGPAADGPAADGPAEDGPAADGPVPAWLTRLAAGAGQIVVPPQLRAPDQGGRASAARVLFGETAGEPDLRGRGRGPRPGRPAGQRDAR